MIAKVTFRECYNVKDVSFAAVRADIEAFFQQLGIDTQHTDRLTLVLEELYTNFQEHNDATRQVSIFLTPSDDGVSVQIEDDGDPFDPREVQSDNLEQDLIDRPVGKLGLLLVQKFTEDLEYRALSDGNELTFKLPYPGA